jgi:transcriptional regulator with XRE-family HTH domain
MTCLKRLRKSSGLTQKQLSELSGVPIRAVQDYEQGHKDIRKASSETVLNLAKVLNTTIEEIIST